MFISVFLMGAIGWSTEQVISDFTILVRTTAVKTHPPLHLLLHNPPVRAGRCLYDQSRIKPHASDQTSYDV